MCDLMIRCLCKPVVAKYPVVSTDTVAIKLGRMLILAEEAGRPLPAITLGSDKTNDAKDFVVAASLERQPAQTSLHSNHWL